MSGQFIRKEFAQIDLEDPFFDSLKRDYPGTESSPGFVDWFHKKALRGDKALVFEDDEGVGAFFAWKEEEEEIELCDRILPAEKRLKISTFRVAERYHRQRIGEGLIGLALWRWVRTGAPEIYVTTFSKQENLISQFEKFGFVNCGRNKNGEEVMLRSRRSVNFSDPYKHFPFIRGNFDHAGYIIIDDEYHDTMFAYSELARGQALLDKIGASVRNGLTKIYVGRAPVINYYVGEPVFVYRAYKGNQGGRTFRSCLTSFCVVTGVFQAKRNGRFLMRFEQLKSKITNKSVFREDELRQKYEIYENMTIVELLYCGFFGAGKNVNLDWLKSNGLWTKNHEYPTEIRLSSDQFRIILEKGKINVQDIVINQSGVC